MPRIGGIPKHCHSHQPGQSFSQQFEPFTPSNSSEMVVRPVTFPPGCERLATSPVRIGSDTLVTTIGIVLVAFFAARAADVLIAKITSTLDPTISPARIVGRSTESSPNFQRIARFCPST